MKKIFYFFSAMALICCSRPGLVHAGAAGTTLDVKAYGEIGQTATGWREINGQTYYFLPETGQMVTGWQEIDGQMYYFLPGSGRMAIGWQEIDEKSYYFHPETGQMGTGRQVLEDGIYYFSPETGVMQTGWQEIDGEKRYFSSGSGQMAVGWQKIGGERYYLSKDNGEAVTGLREIGGNRYYFDSDGVLQTETWIKHGGRKYYSGKSGALLSGWQEIESKTYYFSLENNSMVAGAVEIDGEYYIFNSKGQLAGSKGIHLVTVEKKTYCADQKGKAANGWQLVGNKLYYASKTGKVKCNTTYEGITFGSKGAAKNNQNARLKIKVMQTFASITDDSMTKGQKLQACWSYVVGGNFRYAVKYPDLNTSGWQRQAAYRMLCDRSGNCYGFACVFAALAKEAGYKPYIVCGRVRGTRDRAADGYTRHAWVRINGLNYDPEAQYAGWRRGIYGSGSYPVSHMVQQVLVY